MNLDQILANLLDRGVRRTLTRETYEHIVACGFQPKTLALAIVATQTIRENQPLTLRGLFYRVVSAGWLPDTDKQYYKALMRVMTI